MRLVALALAVSLSACVASDAPPVAAVPSASVAQPVPVAQPLEPAPPAPAATPTGLWREALAMPGTRQLISVNENGYRVDIHIAQAVEVDGATVAAVSFAWSEIDTGLDEPAFTKPRPLAQRPGLPAQVVVGDQGVWVLSTPLLLRNVKALLKTTPTFAADGSSAGVVERPLRKGAVTCFAMPAPSKKKASQPVELCLASGAGIVAVKGVAPQFAEILFAHPDWAPEGH